MERITWRRAACSMRENLHLYVVGVDHTRCLCGGIVNENWYRLLISSSSGKRWQRAVCFLLTTPIFVEYLEMRRNYIFVSMRVFFLLPIRRISITDIDWKHVVTGNSSFVFVLTTAETVNAQLNEHTRPTTTRENEFGQFQKIRFIGMCVRETAARMKLIVV